jgi:hypothetical protein
LARFPQRAQVIPENASRDKQRYRNLRNETRSQFPAKIIRKEGCVRQGIPKSNHQSMSSRFELSEIVMKEGGLKANEIRLFEF